MGNPFAGSQCGGGRSDAVGYELLHSSSSNAPKSRRLIRKHALTSHTANTGRSSRALSQAIRDHSRGWFETTGLRARVNVLHHTHPGEVTRGCPTAERTELHTLHADTSKVARIHTIHETYKQASSSAHARRTSDGCGDVHSAELNARARRRRRRNGGHSLPSRSQCCNFACREMLNPV